MNYSTELLNTTCYISIYPKRHFPRNKTSQQYHSTETPAAFLALAYRRNKFNINFSISKNS